MGTGKEAKQLELSSFPSEPKKQTPERRKQIIVTGILPITKYDEMVLFIEFRLIPSKVVFSKVRSTLWFDGQEVVSALIGIPQRFGASDEFQLTSELDMRGIAAGAHTVKVEVHDLFSSCAGIREETVEYAPVDRTAAYRKIPIVKKIQGEGIAVVSESEKNIYHERQNTRKRDVNSARDKW